MEAHKMLIPVADMYHNKFTRDDRDRFDTATTEAENDLARILDRVYKGSFWRCHRMDFYPLEMHKLKREIVLILHFAGIYKTTNALIRDGRWSDRFDLTPEQWAYLNTIQRYLIDEGHDHALKLHPTT